MHWLRNVLPVADEPLHLMTKAGRDSFKGGSGIAYGAFDAGTQYARVRRLQRISAPLGAGMHGPALPVGRMGAAGQGARAFGKAAGRGFRSGMANSVGGYAWMTLPFAMYETAHAPHGHKLSTLASSSLPWMGTAAGTILGGGIGGVVGGLVADMAIKTRIGKDIQAFADFGRNSPQVHTGGDYQDTQVAYTQRQLAAQQMSGSLLNARQYLGREASLLHS